MHHLPTGTVTFLFSDIEGSTKLLQRLGAGYPAVLEEHSKLMREKFSQHGGVVVSTEGDSFFVVFGSAVEAIAAAAAAQHALHDHTWNEGVVVRVRMGLHTGEGILGGDNYVGLDVHRAARIMSTGYGGQVVISDSTKALVQNSLPPGVDLSDLGEHRLKDLSRPEHLAQLVIDGIPSEFPAIKSLGSKPNNLPSQLTSFIGRNKEVAQLTDLLGRARIVTLTGPGGTGKTRLSLEVARHSMDSFEHGTFFIPLASLTDPEKVPNAVAEALHVQETRGDQRTARERLADHLTGKQMLLVLDNFEQIVGAAPVVSELLRMSDGIKVLVTTRVPLHIEGEHEYPVPPLLLPDPKYPFDAELLSHYESVALFIQRAVTVRPDFEVTNQNAPAIAEICARLDGLPLAIELAAARVRVLTPEALLSRLGERLKLLVGGASDLPQRQQTLRGAIEWSYELLDAEEQRLLRRMSVFVGGCDLEQAEAVCSKDLGIDVFEGLTSLVDKSLVKIADSEGVDVRFFMLETIREYALAKLQDSDEADEVTRTHATVYVELAEEATPHLVLSSRRHWLDRIERDLDNLRAAHRWSVDHQQPELALRFIHAIWRFWHMRGYLEEGLQRVEETIAMPGAEARTPLLAKGYRAAGGVMHWRGDSDGEVKYYDKEVELWEELGDERELAEALYNRSSAEYTRADWKKAQEYIERSMALAEKMGDSRLIALAKWMMMVVVAFGEAQDHERALQLGVEANDFFRSSDNVFMQTWALHGLGNFRMMAGRLDEAETHFQEALRLASDAMDVSGVLFQLDNFSNLAKAKGNLPCAVRLAAVSSKLKSSSGADLVVVAREVLGVEGVGRESLSEQELRDIWNEAESWSVEEAISYAMEGVKAPATHVAPPADG